MMECARHSNINPSAGRDCTNRCVGCVGCAAAEAAASDDAAAAAAPEKDVGRNTVDAGDDDVSAARKG